jgi:hypothetical protein
VIPSQIGTVTESGTAGTAGATVTLSISKLAPSGYTFHYIRVGNVGMGSTIKIVDSKLKVETYDALADNTTIETVADPLIDFSQSNPYGEENF